jgi:hypothetical protein
MKNKYKVDDWGDVVVDTDDDYGVAWKDLSGTQKAITLVVWVVVFALLGGVWWIG